MEKVGIIVAIFSFILGGCTVSFSVDTIPQDKSVTVTKVEKDEKPFWAFWQ